MHALCHNASAGTGFDGAAHERERMHRLNASQPRRPALASMEPPTNVSGCRRNKGSARVAALVSTHPLTFVGGSIEAKAATRAKAPFSLGIRSRSWAAPSKPVRGEAAARRYADASAHVRAGLD